ncbi:MAG: carboxypeptidase regulatory-like domain-containing protein [Gemmatimonadaceae bacterium]
MPLRLLLLVTLLARPLLVLAQDTTHRESGAVVTGIVHDSIARAPLAGAMVQVVVADNLATLVRTAVSDSLGRFNLGRVPKGHYMVGFFHPMLDSLGVDAPLRDMYVDDEQPVRADLAIPSPARLRAAICGAGSGRDSSAVLVGVVRDARNQQPVAGVTVTGEWLELSLSPNGLVRRLPHLVATTAANGWFAMCNVPTAGTVALLASRGADSTDMIEVLVPPEGFARRELYLGPTQTVLIAGDSIRRTDTIARAPRRLHRGDAHLSGTVVAAVGGQPVSAAHVGIIDGPQTVANERGEWTLSEAPIGTRMLEVRAVGYYPDRRPVHVVADAPAVHVALSTLKAVLDTVRVSARRLNRDRTGFLERRHSGIGHYITVEDIELRAPLVTSDLFRNRPGVKLEYDDTGVEKQILVRGGAGEWCAPSIYLDGHLIPGLTADDIDVWVHPKEVAGIEIYPGLGAPTQFQEDMSGCGSILIWTK